MTKTVNAVYEAGNLRLLEPVNLADGTRLAVTFNEMPETPRINAEYLLTLPRSERSRILQEAAAAAAPDYEADLALPASERELTAFTALDAEPVFETQGREDGR